MIVISLKKCDSMCKLVVSPIVSDVHFYRFPTVEPISKGEKKGLVWRVAGVQLNI